MPLREEVKGRPGRNVNFFITYIWIVCFFVDIIGYMTDSNTTRGWWNNDVDPTERMALSQAHRERQRAQHAAGWRRNIALGVLLVAVPVLIRVLTSG